MRDREDTGGVRIRAAFSVSFQCSMLGNEDYLHARDTGAVCTIDLEATLRPVAVKRSMHDARCLSVQTTGSWTFQVVDLQPGRESDSLATVLLEKKRSTRLVTIAAPLSLVPLSVHILLSLISISFSC